VNQYKVNIDWGDGSEKNKKVQIIKTQKNGNQTFAKVIWKCRDAKEMVEKFGILFNVEELVAIWDKILIRYETRLIEVQKNWPDQTPEWQAGHAKKLALAFIDGYLSVRGKLAQSTQL